MTGDRELCQRCSDLRDYVAWSDDDAARIRAVAPSLFPSLPGIVDDFYAELAKHPAANRVITGGESQVARLKDTLLAWLTELLTGPYESTYFERRWRIGFRHVEIGLNQVYVAAALSRIRLDLIRAVAHVRSAAHRAEALEGCDGFGETVMSLMKLLDLELAVIGDAYQTAFLARHDRVERRVQSERLTAMGKAMAGLAHESRNALQRGQACLEMLLRRVEDRPEAVELVTRVQMAQDDLHRLYEEVREYAAPVRLKLEKWDLSHLVRGAWDQLRAQSQGRDVRIRETRGNVDLHCVVDSFAVRQIFLNVFENSLAACADPMEIDVQYFEAELGPQRAVRVRIRDNGPGLTPEQRERMFEEFYTTKTHGTGLGLAICRRLAEAHAGVIAAGEAASPGTEIVVTLPTEQPA